MAPNRMRTTTPENVLATQAQQGCPLPAHQAQRAFSFDGEMRRDEITSALYDLFRKSLAARGGTESFRAAMNEDESFKSDVSKAVNRVVDGRGQRKVPLDWLAGVVMDDDGAFEFVAGVNALLGFEPPVKQRTIDPAAMDRAAREVIAEMDEEHREIYRRKIARKCGVKPDAIKL